MLEDACSSWDMLRREEGLELQGLGVWEFSVP